MTSFGLRQYLVEWVAWREAIVALLGVSALCLIVVLAGSDAIAKLKLNTALAVPFTILAVIAIFLEGILCMRWHGVDKRTFENAKQQGSLYLVFQYFLNIGGSAIGWTSAFIIIFARPVLPIEGHAVYVSALAVIAFVGMPGLWPHFLINKVSTRPS